MIAIGEKLKTFWRRQSVKLAPGATEEQFCAFEAEYKVRLPEDLRKYLGTVNGFDGSEHWMTDDQSITFFGLQEIKPLREYWSAKVVDADGYFVFADYSLSAHVYAIRLGDGSVDPNCVVVVYDSKLVEVASSFAGFVEDYLENIAVLFPPLPAE